MATIIQDVARGAKVYSIRAADQTPHMSDAMLGVCAGALQFSLDIISLSLGIPGGGDCPHCKSRYYISNVFRRFLYSFHDAAANAAGIDPILVAATGNDGQPHGFDMPAKWDFAVAVGSIKQHTDRSSFSTYGTKSHARYIMMPGGEEQLGSGISEWVGEAQQRCYGTSVSVAYASGMLALYLSDPAYRTKDRAAFCACPLG
jgi:subtilisin family serine protease